MEDSCMKPSLTMVPARYVVRLARLLLVSCAHSARAGRVHCAPRLSSDVTCLVGHGNNVMERSGSKLGNQQNKHP